MVDWLRFGADMEDLATQTLRTGKRATGLLGPTIIQPYRGFVSGGVANVRARVMEKPVFDQPAGMRIDATLAGNLLRWVVLDMAGVEVTVTVAGNSVTVNSNADGFVIAKVPVADDLAPGWHEVHFSASDRGREITARGRVVLPDPRSQVGFITDIDDTILTTGMTDGLKALRRTLLRDANGRRPVPGTPSLYRGLARGTVTRPESTFFYVSSGPWNLYDMLVQFLGVRGFPRGPLFLTDWRPGAPTSDEDGAFESHHKAARIRRILDAYPDLQFVLLGDSGERDAEIYAQFCASDPDRIQLAVIRDVTADPTALDDNSSPSHTEPDVAGLVTVRDSVQLAQLAHRMNLVDELTVEEVTTEIDARL